MDDILSFDSVSPAIKNELSNAAKWAKIVGVIGIVFSACIALIAMLIFFGMSFFTELSNAVFDNVANKVTLIMAALFYLALAAVYFYMSYGAYQFGVQVKEGLKNNVTETLTKAFKNLKTYFTIQGIILIFIVSMMGFTMILVFLAGYFS